MPDNTPTTTIALRPESIDMPKIMALLKKRVPVSPVEEATRAIRRERGRTNMKHNGAVCAILLFMVGCTMLSGCMVAPLGGGDPNSISANKDIWMVTHQDGSCYQGTMELWDASFRWERHQAIITNSSGKIIIARDKIIKYELVSRGR